MIRNIHLPGDLALSVIGRDILLAELIEDLLNDRPRRILTINPEIYLRALSDSVFAGHLRSADYMVADGIGMVWLARKYGHKIQRLPGIELAWSLLGLCALYGKKVALCGASGDVLQAVQHKLHQYWPTLSIVFARDGYFADGQEEQMIGEEIVASQASLCLLAMPFVRSERLADRLRQDKRFTGLIMGIGGSFDVWSGHLMRAPLFWQNLHIEWLWRLCLQPERWWRLWPILWRFLGVLALPSQSSQPK